MQSRHVLLRNEGPPQERKKQKKKEKNAGFSSSLFGADEKDLSLFGEAKDFEEERGDCQAAQTDESTLQQHCTYDYMKSEQLRVLFF